MIQDSNKVYDLLNLKREVIFSGSYKECVKFISDNHISDSEYYAIIPNKTYIVLDLKMEEAFNGSYKECVNFISDKSILEYRNYTIFPKK